MVDCTMIGKIRYLKLIKILVSYNLMWVHLIHFIIVNLVSWYVYVKLSCFILQLNKYLYTIYSGHNNKLQSQCNTQIVHLLEMSMSKENKKLMMFEKVEQIESVSIAWTFNLNLTNALNFRMMCRNIIMLNFVEF